MPGPKPQGDVALTGAERQARYRAAHQPRAPMVKARHKVDRRSRVQRWRDAVAELVALQTAYQVWLDGLPENLQGTALADVLLGVCELDLSELVDVELPRGFGRD